MNANELRESLLAAPKNGFARINAEQRAEMEAFCKRYMAFMDEAKTEREATDWAIAEAEKNGFVPFVPFLMAAGLLLALMIHSKLVKHKNIYKTIYYIPYVSSMVAVAIVFKLIFDPGSSGIVNQILMKLGMDPMAFLSDNNWAMAIVILLSIWKSLGYVMIIYLGGLLSISEDIYEAVSLDPISPWMKLTKITLPLLKPTTLFLLTTETISSFQVFTPVNVMTGGGPGYATTTLISLLYDSGFVDFKMGKASAIAVIIFIILSILTFIQNKVAEDN